MLKKVSLSFHVIQVDPKYHLTDNNAQSWDVVSPGKKGNLHNERTAKSDLKLSGCHQIDWIIFCNKWKDMHAVSSRHHDRKLISTNVQHQRISLYNDLFEKTYQILSFSCFVSLYLSSMLVPISSAFTTEIGLWDRHIAHERGTFSHFSLSIFYTNKSLENDEKTFSSLTEILFYRLAFQSKNITFLHSSKREKFSRKTANGIKMD